MKSSQYTILKLLLASGAFGWGVSILGILLPWSLASQLLYGLGANQVPSDSMFIYWVRMASGAFFIIGVMFGLSAWNPSKYQMIIPILGWLSITEGIILTIYGLRLRLQVFPFYGDVTFCLFIGIGIVILTRNLKSPNSSNPKDLIPNPGKKSSK